MNISNNINLKQKKMKQTYFANGFATTGNWIIPFILGWSKSTVIMGQYPIGIMFTLHITPYINIGWNNPRPKLKDLSGYCGCGCCDHDSYAQPDYNPEVQTAIDRADEFYDNSDQKKVLGFDVHDLEDGKVKLVFYVTDMDVEVPEELNGMKTEKVLESPSADLYEEYHDYCSNPEHKIAFELADTFMNTVADSRKVFGYYPYDIENSMIFMFQVFDMSAEIPEEFNGIKTQKTLVNHDGSIIEQEEPKDDIPY